MKTIFRYPIQIEDTQVVQLPKGANILCVQTKHGDPYIWSVVDPSKDKEPRYLRLAGTGHPLEEKDETLDYIGTFQMLNGTLIYHLLELLDPAVEGRLDK